MPATVKRVRPRITDPELSDEDRQVIEWRQFRFRELGFSAKVADALAESKVDLWATKKLLDQGCDRDLAITIVLGTDAMGNHDHNFDVDWFEKRVGINSN